MGVRALRISYVGELGWELHIPTEVCQDESRGERRGGNGEGRESRREIKGKEGEGGGKERGGGSRKKGGGERRRRRLSSDVLCFPSMLLVCMISWYQWEPSVV